MSDTWIVTPLCKTKNSVTGITLDNNSNIYFTTWNNAYQMAPGRKIQTLCSVPDAHLRGIVWNNNTLYICDYVNHKIWMYSLDTGNPSTLAGNREQKHIDGNIKDATFYCPSGIAVDKNGDLYVTQNHCVRKINLSEGTVITIAGQIASGYVDGPAKKATFKSPEGIAVSEDGSIYVADSENDCIRKIKHGVVSTVAGPGENLFRHPFGIALDVDGFIVGAENGLKTFPGRQTIQIAQNDNVFGVARDNYNNIYVGGTNSIMKVISVTEYEMKKALNSMTTWKHTRLFLVGDSGAGKTSLVRWLKGEKFNIRHISTDSVEQHIQNTNNWKSITFDVFDYLADMLNQAKQLHQPQNAKSATTKPKSSQAKSTTASSESTTQPSVAQNPEEVFIPKHFQNSNMLTLKMKQEFSSAFHVWDFAGQEEYYNTHHFFLSESAVYMVVVDLSKPDQAHRAKFWIDSIKSYAPNAPVVMVGTHLDKFSSGITDSVRQWFQDGQKYSESLKEVGRVKLEEICKQITSHKIDHHIAVSCAYGNPKQLQAILLYAASSVPKQECKLSWMLLYDALITPANNQDFDTAAHVSKDDIKSIGEQFKMTEQDVQEALKFFHRVGFVLHYEDIDVVFTKPQQIISVFRTVITALGLKPILNLSDWQQVQEEGRIQCKTLADIWKGYPSSLHPRFQQLLQKFGLAFSDPAQVSQEIKDCDLRIPCLVAVSDEKFIKEFQSFLKLWQNASTELTCKIETVPPLGFTHRLISRILDATNIKGVDYCQLFRGGCVFTQNKIRFMIKIAPGAVTILANSKPQKDTIITIQQILLLIYDTAKYHIKEPSISTTTKCFHCRKYDAKAENLQRNPNESNMFACGHFYCKDCRLFPEVKELSEQIASITISSSTPLARKRFSEVFKTVEIQQWRKFCGVLDNSDWKGLGSALKFSLDTLADIERKNSTKSPTEATLMEWKDSPNAYIDVLIQALGTVDNFTAKNLVEQWVGNVPSNSNQN